jgi:hypothetical protein
MKNFKKLLLVMALLYFLSSCRAVPDEMNVSSLPKGSPPTPITLPHDGPPVVSIGDFTNIESDSGVHQWGYSVALWRQGDSIYGLLSGSSDLRLIGDPPHSLLDDVRFDPIRKTISFTSSVHPKEASEGILYEFTGTLSDQSLAGTLLVRRVPLRNPPVDTRKIVLKRSADRSALMSDYRDLSEWKAEMSKILGRSQY